MSKIGIFLLAALLLLVPAGCGTQAPQEYSNPDEEISVAVGESFIIVLEANPSTGYEWQEEFDAGLLKLLDNQYQAAEHEEGMVGTGGWSRFTFEALGQGQANITMQYKRSWEENYTEEQVFHVSIE